MRRTGIRPNRVLTRNVTVSRQHGRASLGFHGTDRARWHWRRDVPGRPAMIFSQGQLIILLTVIAAIGVVVVFVRTTRLRMLRAANERLEVKYEERTHHLAREEARTRAILSSALDGI